MPRIRTETPTARLRWSNNMKTAKEKKDANGNGLGVYSYGCTLLIDKQDQLLVNQLTTACEEAAREFFKDKLDAYRRDPNFKWPIRDGGSLNPKHGTPHHGDWCWFVNCSSNEEVQVVSRYQDVHNPNPEHRTRPRVVTDATEYYDGMFCKASITFKGFNKGGGFGVAAYINSVQIWHEGDRLDNRIDATDEYDAEGGEAELPPEQGQPAPGYGAPQGQQPAPGYGAPQGQQPAPGYGAPQGQPAPGQYPGSPGYGTQAQQPAPGYGTPNNDPSSLFG